MNEMFRKPRAPAAKSGGVGRDQLAEGVYRRVRVRSRNEARRLVDQVLEEIVEALALDRKVSLVRFGVFELAPKVARVGRNPMTGQSFPIRARRVVRFRPSSAVKRAVAERVCAPRGASPDVPPLA